MKSLVCESCGARLEAGAALCTLCGTPTGLSEPRAETDERQAEPPIVDGVAESRDSSEPGEPGENGGGDRFCIQCGKPSPPEARFCAWCGAAIPTLAGVDQPVSAKRQSRPTREARAESLPHASAGKTTRAKGQRAGDHNPGAVAKSALPKDVNRRVAKLVGAGVVAVVGLFVVSLLMEGRSPSARPDLAGANEAERPASSVLVLSPEVEQSARNLREQIEASETAEEKEAGLRSLVQVYVSAGRFDLAAAVQEELALANPTAAAWTAAGNLHFDWMEGVTSGPDKEVSARRAVQAYSKALELDPNNNDVRTDRAVAYLNDPATAMTAIEEVNKVLESDPKHVQANFNKAVMMTMIGRQEQALEFYLKVTELADPSSPIYLEARKRVDELQASGG